MKGNDDDDCNNNNKGAVNHHNLDLKKAGLARIRINTMNPKLMNPKLKGELRWLLTPRLLKRLQNVQSKAPF
jgi:hypothetical protein